ncbi:MAG: aminotransferase class IV [Pirellulales bacterium]
MTAHQRVVYFNGRFVSEAEARLSIYDSALTLGEMAFEVTRTCGHQPFRLREHLERLFHSMSVMRIDPMLSIDELHDLTLETLRLNLQSEPADVDWNIIHNVSPGPSAAFREAFSHEEIRPTVIISCFPLEVRLAALAPAYDRGLDLVVPPQRSLPGELLDSSIKTRSRLHYQLANLQAHEKSPGATAVLVDSDGYLTEGTSGNVFVVQAGRLLTPCPRNLLPGVTRHVVLELAGRLGIPSGERDLTTADAAAADEIFLTSTSIGLLHGRSWEGRLIHEGRLGPLTARLRAAFHGEVRLDLAAQARLYASRRTAS